jgi:CO/xanthine dehydrogenase Mo-binding subunit
MTSILDRPKTASPTDRFNEDEFRVDGNIKTSGQAKYTADFALPGMLWADFLPGTMAHAKIVSIRPRRSRCRACGRS